MNEAPWLQLKVLRLVGLILKSHQNVFRKPLILYNSENSASRLTSQELFISEIAVIGFLLRRTKGSNAAAKTPRMIVMRYLGYLDTFEKNSPIALAGLKL